MILYYYCHGFIKDWCQFFSLSGSLLLPRSCERTSGVLGSSQHMLRSQVQSNSSTFSSVTLFLFFCVGDSCGLRHVVRSSLCPSIHKYTRNFLQNCHKGWLCLRDARITSWCYRSITFYVYSPYSQITFYLMGLNRVWHPLLLTLTKNKKKLPKHHYNRV